MILYIVANHSPTLVTEWLAKKHKIVPSNAKLTSKSSGVFYIFGLQEFKALRDIHKSSARIILFEGPITAMGFEGANLLDLKLESSSPYYGIKYSSLDSTVFKKAAHYNVYPFKKYCYYNNIIKAIESKSILNPLMTTIYSLPSTSQKHVKVEVVNWFSYDGKVKNLPSLMLEISKEVKISSTVVTQLISILSSDLAALYCKAIKTKGTSEELAERYGISAYDLNYMLSVKSKRKK